MLAALEQALKLSTSNAKPTIAAFRFKLSTSSRNHPIPLYIPQNGIIHTPATHAQ